MKKQELETKLHKWEVMDRLYELELTKAKDADSAAKADKTKDTECAIQE